MQPFYVSKETLIWDILCCFESKQIWFSVYPFPLYKLKVKLHVQPNFLFIYLFFFSFYDRSKIIINVILITNITTGNNYFIRINIFWMAINIDSILDFYCYYITFLSLFFTLRFQCWFRVWILLLIIQNQKQKLCLFSIHHYHNHHHRELIKEHMVVMVIIFLIMMISKPWYLSCCSIDTYMKPK